MKTRNIQNIAIMIIMGVFMTGAAQAQQRDGTHGKGTCAEHQHHPGYHDNQGPFGQYEKIPGITDKQKEDIKAIRLTLKKEVNTILDQVNEKEARLRTLTRSDKPDGNVIDNLIDEIATLHASKRKKTEKARQEIRQMLNDEQKLWFDDHCDGMKKGSPGKTRPIQGKSQKSGRGGR